MIRFKSTSRSGFAVCGPVGEVLPGPVVVTKKDGTEMKADVAVLGKPFKDEDGQELVYGYLWKNDMVFVGDYCIQRRNLWVDVDNQSPSGKFTVSFQYAGRFTGESWDFADLESATAFVNKRENQ